jgi:hypothetical protein
VADKNPLNIEEGLVVGTAATCLVNSHAHKGTLLDGEWICTHHERHNTVKRNIKLSLKITSAEA